MIDTEVLRKKVIELAIQGKITEQLPSDGDAETLYVQILDHKSQLIKEGKIKKDKALPDIAADEIPFEIPKNWKWVRFGELMWNRDSERIPVSVEDRKKLKKTYDYYGASGVIDKVEDYLFDTKLLLIGEDGANLLSRSTPIAFLAEGKYWVNNHAHVLGFYLYDYLDFVMHYINSISLVPYVTGAAQPKLNQDNMNKIPVPLPPLAEQKRIVEKIEDILLQIDIIDDLQAKYSNDLAVLKSKIINAGIQGKLTEQLPEDGDAEDLYVQILNQKSQLIKEGKIKKEKPLPDIAADEIPFEIPKNWKWVRWGIVVNVVSARRVHQSDWRKEGIPFYRAREIAKLADTGTVDNDLFISEDLYDAFSKSGVPQCGDLMVTGVGTLGKTYVVKENEKFYYKDASVLCFENYADLVAPFLKYLMDSDTMHAQISSNSGGTTVDTLTMVRMNQYLMPLPPLEEQKRIVERIDAILAQLN